MCVTSVPDNEEIAPTPEAAASGLAAERTRRINRIDAMRAAGVNPYPYRFDRTHTLGEIREQHGHLEAGNETETRVTVAGRILLKRDQGKLIFCTIRDRAADIQLFISKSVVGDTEFDEINELDLGDWVGVTGLVMTTRKGELSIKVESAQLLSKAVRPLPDKWHGLSDRETKYRKRHLDLMSNQPSADLFIIRSQIVAEIRNFLHERGYLEVETPMLHDVAGGAAARPFKTHHNTLDMTLYMRIANELYLKRLIVGGFNGVYEFSKDFRNEGMSRFHNPEFTQMELYVAYKDYNWMMEFAEQLSRVFTLCISSQFSSFTLIKSVRYYSS